MFKNTTIVNDDLNFLRKKKLARRNYRIKRRFTWANKIRSLVTQAGQSTSAITRRRVPIEIRISFRNERISSRENFPTRSVDLSKTGTFFRKQLFTSIREPFFSPSSNSAGIALNGAFIYLKTLKARFYVGAEGVVYQYDCYFVIPLIVRSSPRAFKTGKKCPYVSG